ncbi:MAG: heavy-metal-associated domain-containing protein [Alkalispirochaetaceae bacterium]
MSAKSVEHKTLDLEGANCTSCKIGIEHMGRRLKGVEDIVVDRENATIELDFDGNPETVTKIIEFVERIGYAATPRE